MKYRRLLHRLAKLIPDPRPVTIRVRWVEPADLQKRPDSSERPTPPQDSPSPASRTTKQGADYLK